MRLRKIWVGNLSKTQYVLSNRTEDEVLLMNVKQVELKRPTTKLRNLAYEKRQIA